jgi:hypothetical protein
MEIDLDAAVSFVATHARIIDRRRLELLLGEDSQAAVPAVLAALDAYQNPDGGYGWGLEPDLRDAGSQPVGALHALEVLEETGGAAGPLAGWLAAVTLPDGGLPFALPLTERAGSAPWWVAADPAESSLHLSTAIVSAALRVARHDPVLRGHPWLAASVDHCLAGIAALDSFGGAYLLRYVLWFLDALHDTRPEQAARELDRVGRWLPESGVLPVEGGVEGEALRPLDFAPLPGRPVRALLRPEAVAADLRRVADGQQPDGGWTVDHASATEAGALEWRGHATVRAVRLLSNG